MNIITIPRRLIKNKYWRPFLPSSKKYWILSQKSCRSSSWSVERLIRGKNISCHCLNYHRLVLISRSSLEEKPNQLGRKYLVLAGVIGCSWSKKPENKKSLSQLPPPPWEGTPLAWLTNELTTSLFVKSIQKWEITILLDFDHPHSGNTGVNLVKIHQTQISFSRSKTEVMQLWN